MARFEPGQDKETGALIVKNWQWEAGIVPNRKMQADLRTCFKRFPDYLGMDRLQINKKVKDQDHLAWLAAMA